VTRIRLPRGEWSYDESRRLGQPGGFGEVFEGERSDGLAVAVKRLMVTADQAAHRELAIADQLAGRSFKHVLGVFDAGEDADTGRYFVVMPRAEKSLADEIATHGTLQSSAAAVVLMEIASGLAELPEIVHRDLKPANILRHDGCWKIADFGIAKFVEDSTSLNTVRDNLTPQFGAPEQWKAEHPDSTTDIYALSCIAYVLLTGEPPFLGPTMADYHKQHLSETPHALSDAVDPRLRSIVSAGLRKAQGGRPRLSRVLEVLRGIITNPWVDAATGLQALRAVNAMEAQRVSQAEAEASRVQREAVARNALVDGGEEVLQAVADRLMEVIHKEAPEAKLIPQNLEIRNGDFVTKIAMRLGDAEIRFESQGATPANVVFPQWQWEAVAIGSVRVIQAWPAPWTHGATLWYMRRRPEDGFRWFEVSYKRNALTRGALVGPFPIQEVGDMLFVAADMAGGPGMHSIEVESGPTPIDDEDVEKFVERWVSRLADAYTGRLRPF
jgi:hypothetical protein